MEQRASTEHPSRHGGTRAPRRYRSRRARPSDEPRERPGEEHAARAALALFALLVPVSALAIGTVHTTTLLLLAPFAALAFALALYARLPSGAAGRYALSLPVLVFGALAFYSLLQTLPLPLSWLRVIAPTNADVWERALLPFSQEPSFWACLSLDPGASLVEALKWALYAATFATAAAISSRRGAAFGVALVFVSSTAAAMTTIVHGLFGATRVYGIYEPRFSVAAWHVGPLLNPNNLAGYLNLGALAGLGLLMTRRPVLPRWLVGIGVALIVGIEITTASRGGVLALALGFIALALLARRRKLESRSHRTSTALALAVIAGGAVLAMLGGTRAIWSELYEKDLSKLEMALWAKPLILDHPFFGIGRGAFESVFPFYRTTAGSSLYTHAENFIVQWAAEWGIPITALTIGTFAYLFRPQNLSVQKSALAAGAYIGVAVLLLQNLFDLALEVPGVCIAAIALLGSLWGDRRLRGLRDSKNTTDDQDHDRSLPMAAAVLGLATFLIAINIPRRNTDVASERSHIRAIYREKTFQNPDDARVIRAEIRAAMQRHPADPYFPLVGALVAFRTRDQSPIPWLQRTLERGQINGRAHLLLAEVLFASRARTQALFELRLSVESDPTLAGPAARLAIRWAKDYDELLSAVPEGRHGAKMLDQCASSLDAENWQLSTRLNREVLARDPNETGPRIREANARIRALAKTPADTTLCADREACERAIVEHADAIAALEPTRSTAARIRARLLSATGQPEQAVKLLEQACESSTDRIDCLRTRVTLAAGIADPAPLDAASRELAGSACGLPSSCAVTAEWLGDLRMGRGEAGTAMSMYERAARLDGTDARWLKLADAASRSGSHARALDALERVARRHHGGDAALKKRIEREREKAMGGFLR